jgi:hypothetical protein
MKIKLPFLATADDYHTFEATARNLNRILDTDKIEFEELGDRLVESIKSASSGHYFAVFYLNDVVPPDEEITSLRTVRLS